MCDTEKLSIEAVFAGIDADAFMSGMEKFINGLENTKKKALKKKKKLVSMHMVISKSILQEILKSLPRILMVYQMVLYLVGH